MADKIIYLEDRSSASIDDKCGMRFWFYKHQNGTGIVPKKEALALRIGKETHEDLATAAEMEDISREAIEEVVTGILQGITQTDKQFRQEMELLYRRLGWFIAWCLFIEPGIRENYEDIGIEKELVLDRDELWVPCTPDRVLVNKLDPKIIIYQEYKTTISAGHKWQQSWRYAAQLHIGLKALEEELQRKPKFARIIGLMKGDYRDGRLAHPYVYGYYSENQDKWSTEYKAGWFPRPVWEYPQGIVAWIEKCGKDLAATQFPYSAPVFLDERLLDDWCARRLRRQKAVRIVKDRCAENLAKRAAYFERKTDQCRPAWGDSCPYLLPCWNATAELDPLGTGEFEPRSPHHEIDLSQEV
jgi:hypothetical protein